MASYSDSLWVVTSYYNPAGYKRRLKNFHAFRRLLNAPLMVVELARPGQHELTNDAADKVLNLTGEDKKIWQKERLLNIAIAELPRHVDYVAWIDCDVVFGDEQWTAAAKKHLAPGGGLLQLFDVADHLPRDVDPNSLTAQNCSRHAPILSYRSIAKAIRAGVFDDSDARSVRAKAASDSASLYRAIEGNNGYGMAWAALREQIEKCGLYDRCIIGGGDSVVVFGALSKLDDRWRRRPHTEKQKQDAALWAKEAGSTGLFSRVDSLPQKLYHLWHGDFWHRDYFGRFEILMRHNFDPAKDIEISENGSWRWADPQSDLARDVGAYFFRRREDGEG